MKDFRKLLIWKRSHNLAILVYGMTKHFPVNEQFGLSAQIRRAVVSVPTNISEGCGRRSDKEFCYFLNVSYASASELQYLIFLSKELGYLDTGQAKQVLQEIAEIKMMLFSFIKKLGDKNKTDR